MLNVNDMLLQIHLILRRLDDISFLVEIGLTWDAMAIDSSSLYVSVDVRLTLSLSAHPLMHTILFYIMATLIYGRKDMYTHTQHNNCISFEYKSKIQITGSYVGLFLIFGEFVCCFPEWLN